MHIPVDRSPDTITAALAAAEHVCASRGLRFTPMRRLVLEALWRSEQPLGAYDLIGQLQRRLQRRLAPPTVYRALDFLMEQKFVARIESRNAFVPCAHPDHDHTCVFFICACCGTSAEIEDPKVEALFAHQAAALGFRIERRVVELQGTCATCASTPDPTSAG
ncbi:Fur family transcriptional regulator [Xanthobacter agilis]|uniref:Ferric uptake regulation protein n=1 Tax=Xanthobacter agilis TaxID=47492 RepID=A0ABU0LJP1_XANAG|nr:Fur family transcriptional regulator [Xanthobacter agilis]MDQ0507298.1 Fur family zinc uptake transcriptional regulator [Xanthobacter agilis]